MAGRMHGVVDLIVACTGRPDVELCLVPSSRDGASDAQSELLAKGFGNSGSRVKAHRLADGQAMRSNALKPSWMPTQPPILALFKSSNVLYDQVKLRTQFC